MKLFVKRSTNTSKVLRSIQEMLGEANVGCVDMYPAPPYIEILQAENVPVVRELIQESGLAIIKEE